MSLSIIGYEGMPSSLASGNLQSALAYAQRGWPVLPLHHITRGGECSCGKECPSPAKHPWLKHGLKNATLDGVMLQAWWKKWPNANIGIRTGSASGLVVLDIDPRHGGDESLHSLGVDTADLPTVQTGGGGTHFYFAAPPEPITNRANIRPGIDLRGENGYVVAPPSNHVSGGTYQWIGDIPDVLPTVPEWVLALLQRPVTEMTRPNVSAAATASQDVQLELLRRGKDYVTRAAPVSAGGRNDAAFRLAGHLAAIEEDGARLPESAILSFARLWNLSNSPPLDDAELKHAVQSGLKNGTARPAKRKPSKPKSAKRSRSKGPASQPARLQTRLDLKYAPFDPEDEAKRFLEGRIMDEHPTLRFWQDSWWVWRHGAYRPLSGTELRTLIMKWLRKKYTSVTRGHVSQIVAHLEPEVYTTSFQAAPHWIDDSPRPDWRLEDCLCTSRAIIHLPSVTENADPAACSIPATPRLFSLNATGGDIGPEDLLHQPEPVEWIRFLESIWGDDPESAYALQQWFGYCLTSDIRQQKILLLIGPKRSGKGSIISVLRAMLGAENVGASTCEAIGSRFGLEHLVDKSLIVMGDVRFGGGTSTNATTERLLSISGGDPVVVDVKGQPAMTARLHAKIMMATNLLPNLRDTSAALASRFLVLKMTKSFFGAEDLDLEEKLLAELPGITSWAAQGWRDLRRNGRLLQPESSLEVEAELIRITAPITSFVEEECVLGDDQDVAKNVLYQRYTEWCERGGVKQIKTKERFMRDLRAAYPQVSEVRPRFGEDRRRILKGIG